MAIPGYSSGFGPPNLPTFAWRAIPGTFRLSWSVFHEQAFCVDVARGNGNVHSRTSHAMMMSTGKTRDWMRRTSPKWPILCWLGRINLNSISTDWPNCSADRINSRPLMHAGYWLLGRIYRGRWSWRSISIEIAFVTATSGDRSLCFKRGCSIYRRAIVARNHGGGFSASTLGQRVVSEGRAILPFVCSNNEVGIKINQQILDSRNAQSGT